MDVSPNRIEFLAIDLEKRTIADALNSSSFVIDEKAFFPWLDTVPYLTEDAVFAVLRDLANFAADSAAYILHTAIIKPERT